MLVTVFLFITLAVDEGSPHGLGSMKESYAIIVSSSPTRSQKSRDMSVYQLFLKSKSGGWQVVKLHLSIKGLQHNESATFQRRCLLIHAKRAAAVQRRTKQAETTL